MDFTEVGIGNMGVDLSCGNISVSKERLDGTDVSAVY